MRFTNVFAVFAAALALNACAATGIRHAGDSPVARTPTEEYAACENVVYRTPTPDKEAALTCAQRLDLWP